MPAESGRGEVCGRPQVETAGEGDAGDTVQGTADPAHLGTVDGKVGGNGAVQALLGQDLGWVLGVGRGGDGPAYMGVSSRSIADDVGIRGIANAGVELNLLIDGLAAK